ncbi:hypothetical protein BD780_000337 [Clostridium tetanomorphum]|uniref:ABC transporter permease subunit n=1 Tax=Clostridium tetanomorphum TaxID=1553 RepID=A0A923EC14_CLOTT|nr:ABC transporter permease [Clostridium tetanomorphum]MBC2398219.1 ABC transporter permease subunit [Clostridium tetanomorphum]MBP1864906.1 hypothetical protein [Clostridium tetanomorphum]NRS83112.1 hypothetical protein [Clostridium tetanomorphum]NRZ98790.1 hypothetical protein [Clostridium tetanomorphum]SQC01158.1 lantibiotic ABC transporter permease [Clostridium tetanomorphum]
MFFKCILVERLKTKRQRFWLIAVFIPMLSILLGLMNFYFNYNVLVQSGDNEWLEAWTQVTLFYGLLILPILSGVYVSMICRHEHMSGGWKQILALPVSKWNIYGAKLLVSWELILKTQASLLVFYIILGRVSGIKSNIPWGFMLNALFLCLIAAFVLASIQMAFTISLKSFSIPLMINIFCTFMGLPILTLKIRQIYPWCMPFVAMSAPDEGRIASFGVFIIAAITIFILATSIGYFKFKKNCID